MPTEQIVSDLFGNIASEDALQETSKRVKPTEVNGKSEFHLGWRMCRDYLKNIPVLTLSSEEAREYEQLKSFAEKIKHFSKSEGREGCTYGDTDFDSMSAAYGYNEAVEQIQSMLPTLKS